MWCVFLLSPYIHFVCRAIISVCVLHKKAFYIKKTILYIHIFFKENYFVSILNPEVNFQYLLVIFLYYVI